MSYRKRHDPSARNWRKWINAHRNELGDLGLPLVTHATTEHWEEFLSFGEMSFRLSEGYAPGFSFRDLDRGQMRALLSFLEHFDEFRPRDTSLAQYLRNYLEDDESDGSR